MHSHGHHNPALPAVAAHPERLNMPVDLTAEVLDLLSQSDKPILSNDAFPSTPSMEIKSALDRLKSREKIIYDQIDKDEAHLTPEAEGIAANGSHEAKVFEAVRAALEGVKITELPVRGLYCTPARLDPYTYDATDILCRR